MLALWLKAGRYMQVQSDPPVRHQTDNKGRQKANSKF